MNRRASKIIKYPGYYGIVVSVALFLETHTEVLIDTLVLIGIKRYLKFVSK